MQGRIGREISSRLARAAGRLADWRRTRPKGVRIPESLWEMAAEVAEAGMADSTIQNPHDGFFKETFGRVEFTREFLAKFLPRDEQLRGQAFMHASLLLLKYIFRPELPSELTRIFRLLAAMSEEDRSLECVRLLLGYVIQGTDRVDQETLRVALKQSLPNRGEELMPTLAEQWANQGREQGLAEGIERGALIGTIETCRSILGEPSRREGLARQPLEELRQLAQQLQSQVRERMAGQ